MAIQVIANLVQGVTQQAAQQARDSQCKTQYDCLNDASSGAGARPGGMLVKMYPGEDLSGAYFSETDHDNENYLIVVDSTGDVSALDLADGTVCTVTDVVPTTYLQAGSGAINRKLRSQVAEDFTFLANTEVTPAMTGTTSAAKVNDALVFVRSTQLNSAYSVALSGPASATATYTTDATNVTPTAVICGDLVADINTGTGTHGYTATQAGSTFRIHRADNAAFIIDVADGNGDDSLLAFNGEATSFSKLPARGFDGMILKVSGEDRSSDDDYYVKFVGYPSTGNWQETVGPGTKTSLDADTMPHAVVNTGYRTFEYRRNTWSSRISGDGVGTSKDPAFIGKKVRDVFYHQRRLAILHASGAVFSKANAPFTFFPDTVQTQLDTAPVDVKPSNSTGKGATSLELAVQVAEKLFLWAQRQQHAVTHGTDSGFSQKTVSTDEAASYEYSPLVDPMAMGPFLYFTTEMGEWSSFRALQFQQARIAGDTDLTAHVPSYIAAGVTDIAGAETLRTIFILSENNPSCIYVFNYLWDGQQFVQQAFNTWRIPGGDVLWLSVRGNRLRVLQQRPEGVAYLLFNLTPKAVDPVAGAKYSTRLDMRVDETMVTGLAYDSLTQTSTFQLPYTPTGPDVLVATREDKPGGHERGRSYEVELVDGDEVTVKGDLTGYKFYVGHRITAERTELEFFVRGEKGSEPTDLLTVNRYSYTLSDTGYSRLEVSSANNWAKQYVFEARRLGGPSAQVGPPPISNGSVEGEINQYAKDLTVRIVNDSFLPSFWQNAAVEYTAVGWKGQR